MVNTESPLLNSNKNNVVSLKIYVCFLADKIRNSDTFASLIYSVEKLAKSLLW